MKKILFVLSLFSLVLVYSCRKDVATVVAEPQPCGTVSFAQQISPIITQKCAGCHSQSYVCGALEDYGTVKVKATNGSLVEKVEKKLMPPSNPLSDAEIQMIKCWVNDGAKNN